MEAKANQELEKKRTATMTVPLSPDEKERIERSFSKEVSREDIQRDVNSILGQMSEQEIQEAREELLHSLDPKLISFLMKRSQYKESMEPAVEMAPVIATEEERPEKLRILSIIPKSRQRQISMLLLRCFRMLKNSNWNGQIQ